MARKAKDGLDYFPLDVNLESDDKLEMIIGEFGIKGEIIYIKLLSWIYKHRGYYTEWNDSEQLKFAKRVSYTGSSAGLIKEVVSGCIKWGLFDQTVFKSFGVLTSKRIQETWLEATRKRKSRDIRKEIWINAALEAEEMPKKAEEIPQSKVNKSKVKESESTEGAPELPSVEDYALSLLPEDEPEDEKDEHSQYPGFYRPPEIPQHVIPSLEEVKLYFHQQGKGAALAERFFNYHEGLGWRKGISPIYSWRSIASNWVAGEPEQKQETISAAHLPLKPKQR